MKPLVLSILLGLAFFTMSCAQETLPDTVTVENVGLDTPESVLYDSSLAYYLVSNIGGDPFVADGNGFISRIAPDGEVTDLKWIDGAAEGVTLNAPKGMALVGGTLFVADMDTVRLFDAATGEPTGDVVIEGATFLNDVAAAPGGGVYVTDTGWSEGFAPTGTDAVYLVMAEGGYSTLLASTSLNHPNGIAVQPDGNLLVVPFGANALYTLTPEGELSSQDFPANSLDGVVLLGDGTTLVSSWETASVYRGSAGSYAPILEGVASPADIGVDTERNRVLVPLFAESRLVFQALP